MKFIRVNLQHRKYYSDNINFVEVRNVIALYVSGSGTHYLKQKHEKTIVPVGWKKCSIDILDDKDFTYVGKESFMGKTKIK